MRKSTQFRSIRCEQLESRQLMAADVLEVEPNDVARNATAFSLPATEEVRLVGSASKRDKDFFVWTATQSGPVATVVATTGGTSNLEIESRAGVKKLEIEQKNGVTKGEFNAVSGETYFVRVRGDANAAGAYAVTMKNGSLGTSGSTNNGNNGNTTNTSDSSVTESEPNDTKPTADVATLGSNSTLKLTGSANKQDRDFFAVKNDSSGNVAVKLEMLSGNVSIESRRGIKMFESESANGIVSGSFAAEQGETYYVRLRGKADAASAYTVTLVHTADPLAPTLPSTTALASAQGVRMDVDGDGSASPLDVLTSINFVNRSIAGDDNPSAHDLAVMAMDFDDDDSVSPLDVLMIVNHVNRETGKSETGDDRGNGGEGEAPESPELNDNNRRNRRGRR